MGYRDAKVLELVHYLNPLLWSTLHGGLEGEVAVGGVRAM
jgi:hypothetical protein